MPDLNTKTLNELDTITEMGENDKVLVESNGRMKKFSGEIGGGGLVVLTEDSNGSIGVSYNQIVGYIEEGKLPILVYVDAEVGPAPFNCIYMLVGYSIFNSDYFVTFSWYNPDSGAVNLFEYMASSATNNLGRSNEPA